MKLLCLEYKACSIEYFLDRMQFYEVEGIMENLNVCVKNDWEMTREVMWSSISPYSKKRIKPSDLMTFPWERKGQQKLPQVEVTQELVEKMKAIGEQNKQRLVNSGLL